MALVQAGFVIKTSPFSSSTQNKVEKFNECIVVCSSYNLLFFSRWNTSFKVKEFTGMWLVGMIGVTVTINILSMLYTALAMNLTKCRLKRMKQR